MDLGKKLRELFPAPKGTRLWCEPHIYVGDTDDYADLTSFKIKKIFRMYPTVSMQDVTRVGFGYQQDLDKNQYSTNILQHLEFLCDMINHERHNGLGVLIENPGYSAEAVYRSAALEWAWKLYISNLENRMEMFNFGAECIYNHEWAAHWFGDYAEQMRVWVEMVSLGRWRIAEEARKEWQMSRTSVNPKEFREVLQRMLQE